MRVRLSTMAVEGVAGGGRRVAGAGFRAMSGSSIGWETGQARSSVARPERFGVEVGPQDRTQTGIVVRLPSVRNVPAQVAEGRPAPSEAPASCHLVPFTNGRIPPRFRAALRSRSLADSARPGDRRDHRCERAWSVTGTIHGQRTLVSDQVGQRRRTGGPTLNGQWSLYGALARASRRQPPTDSHSQ